jgi:hypothetical protein
MLSSRERQDSGITAIASQLAQTQSLIQSLLSEIRDSSASQAALKAEMKQLRYSVQVLSNIIRGGDGHTKPLLSEVEILKHADHHLDKRITAAIQDLEEQLDEMGNALSAATDRYTESMEKQRLALEGKLDATETRRKNDETQKLQLQLSDKKDLRLDGRQRTQMWITVIIAVISLIGSTLALLLKG